MHTPRFRRSCVWAYVGGSKYFEDARVPPHDVADPLETYPPRTSYTVTILVICPRVWAYLWRSVGEIGTLASNLSWSLKVIGTDMNRSATYSIWSLVPLPKRTAISVEIRSFSYTPRAFSAHAEGVPLEFCDGGWAWSCRFGVVLWNTRSCHARHHNDLEGYSNFQVLFIVSLFLCLEHHY